jgi:hypothetical protein
MVGKGRQGNNRQRATGLCQFIEKDMRISRVWYTIIRIWGEREISRKKSTN